MPWSAITPAITAVLTAAAVVSPVALTAPAAAHEHRSDRTSRREALRVDRVPTPTIRWTACVPPDEFTPLPKGAQCATVRVPLDYDDPKGPTTRLGVVRIRAAKPALRIGSLFLNPGGPSGSSTDLALLAPGFLDRALLDRFDIVGVDPRGVNRSENLRCFRSTAAQEKALAPAYRLSVLTAADVRDQLASARALGTACAANSRRLASHMSTAEVARDMDVMRRAVGDKKLTYLGFSYGTQLGQVYANMFPDRFRALAIDGVLDPVAWTTGRGQSARRSPFFDRVRISDAAYLALRELMARCDRAGRPACEFAGSGNSMAKFDTLAGRLKKKPAALDGPYTYNDLLGDLLADLYDTKLTGRYLGTLLQRLWTATGPKATAAQRTGAARSVAALRSSRPAPRAGAFDAYANQLDVFAAVTCTDGDNPRDPKRWVAAARAADRRAPYFGPVWVWGSAPCAGKTWTLRDEDRYTGPFTRRTAAPVLVVGNYWDAGTSYRDGAVRAARLLPNSRLLTSDSWGHTAYGTSSCVSDAVGRYLIAGTLPARGTVCTGPQPFRAEPAAALNAVPGGASGSGSVSTARPVPVTPWPVGGRI